VLAAVQPKPRHKSPLFKGFFNEKWLKTVAQPCVQRHIVARKPHACLPHAMR
jgi:hypothetical protein